MSWAEEFTDEFFDKDVIDEFNKRKSAEKIKCSLCDQEFLKHDPHIEIRKDNHERWHTNCRLEKRNTTEGKVKWI